MAEDGVLPDWFLKPHRRYGTNYRVLYLITGLQLFTIFVSRGDVILLGEAYAFGVVWSFVFNTLSMVVLRFKKRQPREFVVPFNIRWRGIQVPIGLSLIFLDRARVGTGEPGHQAGRHDQRRLFFRRVFWRSSPSRNASISGAVAAKSTSISSNSIGRRSTK